MLLYKSVVRIKMHTEYDKFDKKTIVVHNYKLPQNGDTIYESYPCSLMMIYTDALNKTT